MRFVAAFLLSLVISSAVCAKDKVLTWGADASSGAPYIFRDPSNPSRIIGFEVDIADALARDLSMEAEFVQNQWDSLIPGLNRDNYMVVINGIEITNDRKVQVEFSDPYYLGSEQLTVRKETYDVVSLKDLNGKKAGTLKATLAERMLQSVQGIDVLGYDTQTTLYDDLANGRIYAVLLDNPAALYYGGLNRKLKVLPNQVGELSYGIAIRRGHTVLLNKINLGLRHLVETGRLRQIYEKWGIWNPAMAQSFKDSSNEHSNPTGYQDYVRAFNLQLDLKSKIFQYASYLPLLGRGAITTIELSILAMAFAMILGLFIALVRLYGPAPLQYAAASYTEFVRGTPLLIQLFLIYYGLPNIGLNISPFPAAVLGLALNYSAYESEVYRAGIRSIPHSQMEAAFSLGFTRLQALRYIIIPQALRLVIPPMTNDFISLLKDSSLVSVITMVELTRVYGQLATTYYDYFGIGIMAAIVYFVIGMPFVRLSRYVETRMNYTKESLCLKI